MTPFLVTPGSSTAVDADPSPRRRAGGASGDVLFADVLGSVTAASEDTGAATGGAFAFGHGRTIQVDGTPAPAADILAGMDVIVTDPAAVSAPADTWHPWFVWPVGLEGTGQLTDIEAEPAAEASVIEAAPAVSAFTDEGKAPTPPSVTVAEVPSATGGPSLPGTLEAAPTLEVPADATVTSESLRPDEPRAPLETGAPPLRHTAPARAPDEEAPRTPALRPQGERDSTGSIDKTGPAVAHVPASAPAEAVMLATQKVAPSVTEKGALPVPRSPVAGPTAPSVEATGPLATMAAGEVPAETTPVHVAHSVAHSVARSVAQSVAQSVAPAMARPGPAVEGPAARDVIVPDEFVGPVPGGDVPTDATHDGRAWMTGAGTGTPATPAGGDAALIGRAESARGSTLDGPVVVATGITRQTDAAAPVSVPEPVTRQDMATAVVDQVVKSLRMQWKNGLGEARIQLRPEHLGPVDISIRVEGGAITAVVRAESAQVQEWILNHQQSLRQQLEASGLRLDDLVVSPDAERRRQREQEEPEARRALLRRRRAGESEPIFNVVV